ncbi:MAG: hypothetical protein K6E56_01835 [Lachnospiraceae bacterium]|nr:hypothetical protein [Lachnospiraceae bacterium]
MNQGLFSAIINAIKSKIMPLVTKIRLYTSFSYIRTRVLTKIREFFVKLLDIRPRHKKDYYTLAGWMVSKRLAFAVVIILGALSLYYLIAVRAPFGSFKSADGIKTYKYTSVALRMQKGMVRIKGNGGYLAYEGNVEKGYVKGYGTLFNRDGEKVYLGNFEKSKYEGNGTLYYPGEIIEYTGEFAENLFQGKGKLYRESGTMEYEGDFVAGLKEGEGTLHDNAGNAVFTGMFAADDIAFSQMVGMQTTELASSYTGKRKVYSSSRYMGVYLSDIDVIYSIPIDNEEIGDATTVTDIYVLRDSVRFGNKTCTSITEITEALGSPSYQGDSYATYPELIGIYEMNKIKSVYSGTPDMDIIVELNDLYTVDSYTFDYPVYLYSFEKDGLVYSFLTRDTSGSGFDMYFITAMNEGV